MSFAGKSRAYTKTGASGLAGLEYFGLQDYRNLLVRRKWTIVTATLVIALLVSLGAYLFPNLYRASTVIIVDPGKVPESFVKSTATIDANQRLAILQAQILSTTRLSQVIDELGLYKGMKKTRTQDEIVARMHKDIKVEPVVLGPNSKELQAFKVSYESRNAVLAAKVSNRLSSLFIEENLKVREQQVLGTADFFDRELEKAKQDMDQKSQALAELRARFVASLPESQNMHVQALTTAQLEVRAEMDAASRAEHQKVYLQSLLADNPLVVDLDSSSSSLSSSGLEEQLERVQAEMDQLRSRYGPDYPDVQTKMAEIETLQAQIKEQEKAAPVEKSAPKVGKRHNPVVESQIAQLNDEIQKHEARQKDLQAQVAYYQSTLQGAPQAEQQLTAATNDYANAEDRYKRLEEHKFSADMSSDVEARQKGERFVILEPAQPPEHPYAPNRPVIDALGLVAGLILALCVVVGLEILDTSVKTQRELDERLKAPVFGEIPWLATRAGSRRRRVITALAASGNLVLVLGYVGLLALAFR